MSIFYRRLSPYISESRNLIRISDNRRAKYLHVGKLSIVSFLNDLPKTQHNLAEMTCDITVATDDLIVFSVTGVFRERNLDPSQGQGGGAMRHFSRQFVITKVSESGWNVVNETLFVTNPTGLQLKVHPSPFPFWVYVVLKKQQVKRMYRMYMGLTNSFVMIEELALGIRFFIVRGATLDRHP